MQSCMLHVRTSRDSMIAALKKDNETQNTNFLIEDIAKLTRTIPTVMEDCGDERLLFHSERHFLMCASTIWRRLQRWVLNCSMKQTTKPNLQWVLVGRLRRHVALGKAIR